MRLLLEADAISGARLRIDERQHEAFQRSVKERARINAVAERAPIIRNFREVTARDILVFTTVLTLLAGTIAIGVVYNTVRIALAERA